jgi:pyruvate dehydrogenase E1 component alpha subunit
MKHFMCPKVSEEIELQIAREKLIEMYKSMELIRHFEYTVNELYARGKIFGALHLYAGEEAVAVGVCANLRPDDYAVSTHRGHGHCIAKGADVKRLMAELFGRSTGVCKGKGGSMHLADVSVGMLGASGIVGGGIPLAAGAALSAKYRGTDQVAVGFFGDGASNQGVFHESLNLASIWDLPVIYVCENNQYAESTAVSAAMRVKNVADRAAAYAMPGKVVDGMDVIAVHEAAKQAVERARQGEGPTLIECKTYRFEGHEMGDAHDLYRSKEEVEQWKKRCPIRRLRQTLISSGGLTEREAEKMEQEVKKQIEDAIKFADESPYPDPEEALRDVFVSPYF